MPSPLGVAMHGEIDGIGVCLGVCNRCHQANGLLPRGTVQKRLNAAAALAARDTTARYWTARFPDAGAARLAAGMLGRPETSNDIAGLLGWR